MEASLIGESSGGGGGSGGSQNNFAGIDKLVNTSSISHQMSTSLSAMENMEAKKEASHTGRDDRATSEQVCERSEPRAKRASNTTH